MCIRLIFVALFLSFHIYAGEGAGEKINFNYGWQFIRLEDSINNNDTAGTKTIQQGTEWQTQFNVDHIETVGGHDKETISDQLLKKELNSINNQIWEPATLPHSAYLEPYTIIKPWQGICYYRKSFTLDKATKGKKIFLEFEGAMQLADVWINGKHLSQHAGGFTPFIIDLSNNVIYDKPNQILVRLDNRDKPCIPPGKPLASLDFCYHSGIYRDVNLIVKNRTYITNPVVAMIKAGGGVFVTYPEVSNEKASLEVKVHIKNEDNKGVQCQLNHQLIDSKGLIMVTRASDVVLINNEADEHITTRLSLDHPELWSPDYPNLYTLKTQLLVDGKLSDEVTTRIGIRHLEINRENGLVLNVKPIRVVGTNRHMEYPYVGNAISDNAQYRDMYKIKMAGFNAVRLAHYPQDPSVLDACDELGLLVIAPIPGWQFFNKDTVFIERTYRDVRDLIRRDRNHPSIIIWETTLNESSPPDWWKDMARKIAHEEYPGSQCFTAGDMYGYHGWDVLYNDWNEDITRPNDSKKPGFIREYGDYEFGGHYSTTRVSRKDGEKGLLQNAWNFQWSHNKYRQQYPWTIGDANWSMYDYNRGCCDNICYSGISELNRLPKFAYYFYKSQLDIGSPMPNGQMAPMLYIANWWIQRETGKVIIYGNVDEVELQVNGKNIARHKPDSGPNTPYESVKGDRNNGGNPFDGGNSTLLKHPPFTFNNIEWSKGELKAIGYFKGENIITQTVHTPQEPHKIRLTLDESGKKLSENDIAFLYAEVLDKNETLCADFETDIKLEVNGDIEILSPETMKTEAGIAAFLIKTGIKMGSVIFKAISQKNNQLYGILQLEKRQ